MKWLDLFVRPPQREQELQLDYGTHRCAEVEPILGESWLAGQVHDLKHQSYIPF